MASERPAVRCVECEKVFRPWPHEREDDEGGVRIFLECPHCMTEYEIAWMTRKGRELRAQAERMRESGATTGNSRRLRRVLEELREEVHRIEGGSDA